MRATKSLALTLAAAVAMTVPPLGHTDPAPRRVNSLFAQWDGAGSPGCSVAISRNGRVVYEHAYGMASVELGVPITTETVLGAASISKQFTAMSILLLAERRRLSLDDEISKYVPEWADRESHVTIRHLLTHTSGLREGFSLLGLAQRRFGENENEAMVRVLARQKGVNFAPGAEWQYNNGGYNLLGSIVKRVSGQSLRDFEKENIFKPLGMKHSQIRDDGGLLIPHLASGYTADATGIHPTSEVIGVVGNAGLYTTPGDLLLWEDNFESARVGTPGTLAAMQKPAVLTSGKTTSYGFGLFIGNYRGLRTIEHSGGDSGIASNLVRYPDHKLAIALLCNSDTIDVIDLTHKLTDLYLNDVLTTAPPANAGAHPVGVKLNESELARRVGTYRVSGGLADLEVSVRDGKLIGHSYYDDDVDFDLIPVDSRHVSAFGVNAFEFVPSAANHPQEWIVTRQVGNLRGVLQLVAPAPAKADFRALAGEYRSSEIEASYDVTVGDSGLLLQAPGASSVQLRPFGKDAFTGPGVGGVLQFFRDSHGEVIGFTMNRYNLRGLRFDRLRRAE
jgi:CubicO group peptidase (beta-lactamase class C family)